LLCQYTLKIHNGVESKPGNDAILEAQSDIMRRLQAGGTECPVPVPTKLTNEDMVFLPLPSLRGGHVRLAVRVLTWVEGRTMSDVGSDGE